MREPRLQHRGDGFCPRRRQFEIRRERDRVDRIVVGIAVDVDRARLLVERGRDLLGDRGEAVVDPGAAGRKQHQAADADEDGRGRLIGVQLVGQDLRRQRGADPFELRRGRLRRIRRRLDHGFAGDREFPAG